MELPGLDYVEPSYSTEVDWLICDALDQLALPDGQSCYLRLSTRPVDQGPFKAALEVHGEKHMRTLVLAGGYRLVSAPVSDRPGVTMITTGALTPNAVAAAEELGYEGVDATVINLTSPDRTYRSWQQRHQSSSTRGGVHKPSHIHRLVPADERARPVISVQDGASHSLAWIGSALGTTQIALGVDRFGESGTIEDLHEITGISTGNIVNAALIAINELPLSQPELWTPELGVHGDPDLGHKFKELALLGSFEYGKRWLNHE